MAITRIQAAKGGGETERKDDLMDLEFLFAGCCWKGGDDGDGGGDDGDGAAVCKNLIFVFSFRLQTHERSLMTERSLKGTMWMRCWGRGGVWSVVGKYHTSWWIIIKFTPYEWNMAQNKSEWETQFSTAPFGDFLSSIPSSLRIHDLVPLVPSITRWDLANASTRVIDRTSIHTEKMTKAWFQKRWTPHLEMIQRTCKKRCEYLLRLLSFVGWHFWGFCTLQGTVRPYPTKREFGKSSSNRPESRGMCEFPGGYYIYDIPSKKIIKKRPVTWRGHTRSRVLATSGPMIRPWPKPHCLPRELLWQRRSWTCEKPVVGGEGCFVPCGMGRDFLKKCGWMDGMYEVGYKVVRL